MSDQTKVLAAIAEVAIADARTAKVVAPWENNRGVLSAIYTAWVETNYKNEN